LKAEVGLAENSCDVEASKRVLRPYMNVTGFERPLKLVGRPVDTNSISILPSTTAGPRFLSRGPAFFLAVTTSA